MPRGGDKRRTDRYQFTDIDIVSKIRFLAVYKDLTNINSITFVRDALAFYEEIGIKPFFKYSRHFKYAFASNKD